MRCVIGVCIGRVKRRRLPPARWSVASGGLIGGACTGKSQGSVGRRSLVPGRGASRASDGLSDNSMPNITRAHTVVHLHSNSPDFIMLQHKASRAPSLRCTGKHVPLGIPFAMLYLFISFVVAPHTPHGASLMRAAWSRQYIRTYGK